VLLWAHLEHNQSTGAHRGKQGGLGREALGCGVLAWHLRFMRGMGFWGRAQEGGMNSVLA